MIAITGGTGFIGRNFLQAYPGEVKVLCRENSGFLFQKDNIKLVRGDMSLPDFSNLLSQAQVLLHFACSITPRRSHQSLMKDVDENLNSTLRLFEQYISLNPKGKIIFLSSGGAIYNNNDKSVKSENSFLSPETSYGVLKVATEGYLQVLTKTKGIKAVSLRVSNPYGELFPSTKGQGFVGVALKCALEDQPLTIFENKDTIRDYVHINDLVKAIHLSMDETQMASGEHRIYNIGSGSGFTLSEVIQKIENIAQKNIRILYKNQSSAPTSNILDIKKVYNDLKWKPTASLDSGIAMMIQGYEKEIALVAEPRSFS